MTDRGWILVAFVSVAVTVALWLDLLPAGTPAS